MMSGVVVIELKYVYFEECCHDKQESFEAKQDIEGELFCQSLLTSIHLVYLRQIRVPSKVVTASEAATVISLT